MQTALYFNGKRFTEKEFSKERDFELLTFEHAAMLFGQGSLLIDAKKKIDNQSLGATIPDAFLFDLKDPNNPEFYLMGVELAKHSFYNHIVSTRASTSLHEGSESGWEFRQVVNIVY